MANRSIRARGVDRTKPLSIVRDESELDRDEARSPSQPEADTQQPKKRAAQPAIPVPPVTQVATYNVDYLPLHRSPLTYLKAPRSKLDLWEHEYHEYDLDVADCRFMHDINQAGTQDRLPDRDFEAMLWHLEVANAAANERIAKQNTTVTGERAHTAAINTTENLPKEEAMECMARCTFCQAYVRERVYGYWKDKRKRLQKPLLRRLQAPTPETDKNPYLVFRQRARPSRGPRSRRETQEKSLEKIASILESFKHALDLTKLLRQRELAKAAVNNNFVDRGQYTLLSLLGERPQEELNRCFMDVTIKEGGTTLAFEPKSLCKSASLDANGKRWQRDSILQDALGRRPKSQKKLKRATSSGQAVANPLANLPTRPECNDLFMPFAEESCTAQLTQALKDAPDFEQSMQEWLDSGRLCPRIGRGRRLLFDQLNLDTYQALGQPQGPEDPSETQQQDAVSQDLQTRLSRLLWNL